MKNLLYTFDVSLNELNQIEIGEKKNFNIGYLFVNFLYHQLGLDKFCEEISKKHKIEYNLSDVLSMLISTRIIAPSSKLSSYYYAFNFLEQPSFELHHVYRSLDILSNYCDEIQ
ncbi:MAG: hypothetical protein Q4B23_05900 [Helcococcus sp.]|nr:hypothetical protein [Helcococcus sp.]